MRADLASCAMRRSQASQALLARASSLRCRHTPHTAQAQCPSTPPHETRASRNAYAYYTSVSMSKRCEVHGQYWSSSSTEPDGCTLVRAFTAARTIERAGHQCLARSTTCDENSSPVSCSARRKLSLLASGLWSSFHAGFSRPTRADS